LFARPTLQALMLLTLLLTASTSWPAASLRTPHVQLTLETETAAVQPGATLWAGLHFELIPDWHIYWRNPGDSGEPPRVRWELPPGWQAGDIHWPLPQRIPVGPLVNYGYADQATLLVPLQLPEALPEQGSVRIAAELTWLVCREECIPESGRLEIELPIGPAAAVKDEVAARFEATRSTWPISFPGKVSYRANDQDNLTLQLRDIDWAPAQIEDLWFASASWGPIAASGQQHWTGDTAELLLTLPAGEAPLAPGAPLTGLLVITEQTDDGPLTRGFRIDAEVDANVGAGVDAGNAAASSSVTLWAAVGLALLGGLLLNLMPCVLPVLAIKVLGLVRHAQSGAVRHGLVFGVGVLASFAALAALLIALRAGGAALGWGFQLQEPLVIVGLMFLMLAIGLNLSGVYHLGDRLAGVGQGLAERPGLAGTFATGVLAVVVASPCTAPFMGSALGFALTRPPGEALLVFLALGSGFALPVLALSVWPQWLQRLPPPGPWMERLRNGLAFPMYGAAAWLLWVLSQQVDAATLAAALSGAVLVAFALWWYGQPLHNPRRKLLVVIGLLAAGFGLAAWAAIEPAPDHNRLSDTERWSPARVEQLREQGQPLLVNFTAAWCITCKVNEQVALGTERVRAALQERGVAYLKGDWTRRDPIIGAELQRHGRSGVPLYLLYPPGDGQPRILPQLLTERLVLQAIDTIHNEE